MHLLLECKVYLIVNSSGVEQMMIGNYIYLFDGNDFTGIYDVKDLGFEKNLIRGAKTPEMILGEQKGKAWFQDYMNRVINRKLN